MSIAKNLIPGVGVAYSKYWGLSSLYIYNIIIPGKKDRPNTARYFEHDAF